LRGWTHGSTSVANVAFGRRIHRRTVSVVKPACGAMAGNRLSPTAVLAGLLPPGAPPPHLPFIQWLDQRSTMRRTIRHRRRSIDDSTLARAAIPPEGLPVLEPVLKIDRVGSKTGWPSTAPPAGVHNLACRERPWRSVKQRIETGFDEAFDRKWICFEHIAWMMMVLVIVVVVGLAGRFGRGRAVRAQAAASPIQVEYERVMRYDTQTEITVTSAGEQGIQRLFVVEVLAHPRRYGSHPPRSSRIGSCSPV
jgi:hypothetical protein